MEKCDIFRDCKRIEKLKIIKEGGRINHQYSSLSIM
jgi:hypothetical protein